MNDVRGQALVCALVLAAAGCGGDDEACVAGTSTGCDEGLVCEEVQGGQAACFSPVFIEGRVLDAIDDTSIAGARVVAVDANGAPRSTVVESAADGTYSLPVATVRSADGAPLAAQVTLRADAAGYQTFPTAPRTGIPIELSSGASVDGRVVVMNAATDVALVPRDDVSGVAEVRGRIEPATGGVLVVAEQSGRAVATAISALDGTFTIFDVPTSSTTVGGWARGISIAPVDVSVVAPSTEVVLAASGDDALATVSGSVQIVNGGGAGETSVILVLESTFVESTARGEAPPGLRAFPVSGAWSIDGVAPGRYVALAAFENDGLVRDPDTSIGGTEIVHFEVTAGMTTVELGDGFKVTGALAVSSPGAEVIEVVSTSEPTFVWEDDSSEDGYELRVYDALGTLVHEDLAVPRVNGSATVSYTMTGVALEPGMIYQFRAWSYHDEASGHVLISATEDLLGVFTYEP